MTDMYIMVTRAGDHIKVEAFHNYETAERQAEYVVSLWSEHEKTPQPPNWNGEDYSVWDELEQLQAITDNGYDVIIEKVSV